MALGAVRQLLHVPLLVHVGELEWFCTASEPPEDLVVFTLLYLRLLTQIMSSEKSESSVGIVEIVSALWAKASNTLVHGSSDGRELPQ